MSQEKDKKHQKFPKIESNEGADYFEAKEKAFYDNP